MNHLPSSVIPDPRRKQPRFRWRRALLVIAGLVVALLAAAGVWYYRVTHHVTRQELTQEVSHSRFTVTLRGQPVELHLYQQTRAKKQRIVFFTSGDGGWSVFCADTAAHIANQGFTLVGFDVKDYMTRFATPKNPLEPEVIARDYASLLSQLKDVPDVDANALVILSGWSLGAAYSVLAAALSPEVKSRSERLLAMSLPERNVLAWKLSDSVIYITKGVPHEKTFKASDYLPHIAPLRFQLIYATDDTLAPASEEEALFGKVTGPKQLLPVKARDHRYEDSEDLFYQTLDKGLRDSGGTSQNLEW